MMPGNSGQRKTARPTDEGRNWEEASCNDNSEDHGPNMIQQLHHEIMIMIKMLKPRIIKQEER